MPAKTSSVVGCSTCGALYAPVPGDQGVCDACRITVADDPSARPLPPPTPLFASDEPDDGAPRRQAGAPRFRPARGRGSRRVTTALVMAALLAGGAAALAWKRDAVRETWTSIRRHSPAEAWSAIRRRSTEAWIAVRRHIPIQALQGEDTKAGATAPDATASRGTHRRSQHNGKGKRSKGEHAIASQ